MDKYIKIEKRLRNLEMDKMYLESLLKDLEIIELEYSITGISYDGIGGSSGVGDSTGDTAIRLTEKKNQVELRIAKKQNEIEHIEAVLDKLTAVEAKIIIMWYLKYQPLWRISQETGYSISQVKRIKKDAMDKIIVGMYGEG